MTTLAPWSNKILVAPNGCWIWTGYVDSAGYVKTTYLGRKDMAHRISWRLVNGDIPKDRRIVIDHLCRVRRCCAPDHLQLVTQSENVRRGRLPELTAAMNRDRAASMATCRRGHPYAGDNLGVRPSGKRYCVTCQRALWIRSNNKRRGKL